MDIGDLYLSIIAQTRFEPTVRSIGLPEFWETIVGSALLAFKDISGLTYENKVSICSKQR